MFLFTNHSSPFCWSCASTHRSRQQIFVPQVEDLMQARTYFPKVRRMLLFLAPFHPNTLLASFHAASRPLLLPLCLFLRPILKFCSVGATLMRFTWAHVTERGILVSNFSMTRNSLCELHTLDWLRHVSALPWGRLRRLHVLKYTTQLKCIRWLTIRWILSQFLITPLPRFPRSIVTFIGDRFSFLPITLLQHSHCTFVIILFGPFTCLFIKTVSKVSPIDRLPQQISQDLDIHTRSSPGLMKLKTTRSKASSCCGTFFSWFLLSSFFHCSSASCRTEMADVDQIQQMIPLITCEIPFG